MKGGVFLILRWELPGHLGCQQKWPAREKELRRRGDRASLGQEEGPCAAPGGGAGGSTAGQLHRGWESKAPLFSLNHEAQPSAKTEV